MRPAVWSLAVAAVVLLIVLPARAAPSFDVRKPAYGGAVQPVPSWTGPVMDPHAEQGQWFKRLGTDAEEVRTHEFHDNVPGFGGGFAGHGAIHGVVDANSVVQVAGTQAILAFDMDVTVTNDAPGDDAWMLGDNSHEEWLPYVWRQYDQTLFDAKITAEFAIDAGVGPPPLAHWPVNPYRDEVPHIVAKNHDQIAWYCWSPDNPDPEVMPAGNYYVPTWDLGSIPPGWSVTIRMEFEIDVAAGLPQTDPRWAVIMSSAQDGIDILLNRSSSLKVSTWIDSPGVDLGMAYPHEENPDEPAFRSSDCSVFHNRLPSEPGGLSLEITKPPVQPDVQSYSGPPRDPDALQGQWFLDAETMEIEEVRTHEFYDPVHEMPDGTFTPTSGAIRGVVTNIQWVGQNITGFDIQATVTNNTPWPYDWADGSNSHDEFLQTAEQYMGPLLQAKLTAEFAIAQPPGPPPASYTYPPYMHDSALPHIVAQNHQQLAWYCWTPGNDDPRKQDAGAYFVPTWDLGDILHGASVTVTMSFIVDPPGLDPGDLRHVAIVRSTTNGDDILANRETSLKVSTWIDSLDLDDGSPYPGTVLRSSDCSVFHNAQQEPEEVHGLSLDVRKPPYGGRVMPLPSWTGPNGDPHALKGQWFESRDGTVREVRSHEYYDNVLEDVVPVRQPMVFPSLAGFLPGHAIFGHAENVQFGGPSGQNIISFDIEATIVNLTPWPDDWWEPGDNRHDEWLYTWEQYEGPLLEAKLVIEFAIDRDKGPPPPGFDPPYRSIEPRPNIVAENHDQLAWYCWTPGRLPDVPQGDFYVPTWDFGTIQQGQAVTRTLSFTTDQADGIPQSDLRYNVIVNSLADKSDILLNRSTSLKVSTWLDEPWPDNSVPFPHRDEPNLPMRSSDCSVFHNIADDPLPGGFSIYVTKPPVGPDESWTGPTVDPHSVRGQWFLDPWYLLEDWRTCEFYDNVRTTASGRLGGYGAIYGAVNAVTYDPTSGNITAFTVDAFIVNDPAQPDEWNPGTNSHGESIVAQPELYFGTMYDTKLAAEFAIDPDVALPPAGTVYPPYRLLEPRPNIVAQNHDQLAWYCWTYENPDGLWPFGDYYVPTWDFGHIPVGTYKYRTLEFIVQPPGLDGTPGVDPRFQAVENSYYWGDDVLLNRSSSLKISTWIDEISTDLGVLYPQGEGLALRSSDCSVFHDDDTRLRIVAGLDYDWCYTNTQTSTADRHMVKILWNIAREADPAESYTFGLKEDGGPLTNFAWGAWGSVPGGIEVEVLGGRRGVVAPNTAADPDYLLTIWCRGNTTLKEDSVAFPVVLRPLGDVTGDLNTNIDDQAEINNKLNGLAVTHSFRELDLTGDGVNVNIDDQAIINSVLNGVTVP